MNPHHDRPFVAVVFLRRPNVQVQALFAFRHFGAGKEERAPAHRHLRANVAIGQGQFSALPVRHFLRRHEAGSSGIRNALVGQDVAVDIALHRAALGLHDGDAVAGLYGVGVGKSRQGQDDGEGK